MILDATVSHEGGGAVAQGGGGRGITAIANATGVRGRHVKYWMDIRLGGGEVSEQHEMIISGAGTT